MEATFKEKCNYNTFTGLTLMKPQFGQSYEIEVKPGQSKMVLLRCSPEGYSVSMSLLTTVVHGGKALKELARNKGKRAERCDTDSGEFRSIYVYTY